MSSQKFILGLSGIDRGFAVSLADERGILFAIEEDKLRRFKGLGLRHLETLGSRAIDEAVSRVAGGIGAVRTVVYSPPIDVEPDASVDQQREVGRFLSRHYGVYFDVTLVNQVVSHVSFERAVHGPVGVMVVGRARAVYSGPGSDSSDLDAECRVVPFVEACARFIGLEQGRMHHLENIARLGEPRFTGRLRELLVEGADPGRIENALAEAAGSPRLRFGDNLEPGHRDLAASAFKLLEEEIVALVRAIPEGSQNSTIALCGELFQSWRLNDAIAREFPANRFVVSFSPGDPACAIGGALAHVGSAPSAPLTPFLGPGYDRNQIKSVLDNCKARYALHSGNEAVARACDALAAGKMVGWFYGACEFGYRALGGRSVLVSPADPYACDNLSSFLKKRPSYFPYAVAMKEQGAPGAVPSPFLSRSIHLPEFFGDNPVRLQTVSKSTAPGFYNLLDAFQAKSGVPALLNTSLNYFEEPIACTPRDALKTFYASGLDMLVIEDFVLTKS